MVHSDMRTTNGTAIDRVGCPCLTVVIADHVAGFTACSLNDILRSLRGCRIQIISSSQRGTASREERYRSIFRYLTARGFEHFTWEQLNHMHVAIDVILCYRLYSPRVDRNGVDAIDLPGDNDRLEFM